MQAMEELTHEIERKETALRQESERVELLAAKLARKEKHLGQEEQRLGNWERDLAQSKDEVVRQ